MTHLLVKNPIINILNIVIEKISIASELSDYFAQLFLKGSNQNIKKFLYCIGSISLTITCCQQINKLVKTWSWLISHIKNIKNLSKQKLNQKYRQNCYIGITGFTGGIGWSYTNLFAKYNHNLLLIDCNQQNVIKKVKLLKQYYPTIDIKYFVADFTKDQQIDKLCVNIKQISRQIDIGIFINNSGLTAGGDYLQIDPASLIKCSQVNIISSMKICKQIVPILNKRQKRSALINMTSCTGYLISSHVGVYSMTKKIFDIYTQYLQKQHHGKIDIISVRPFGVITPMMKMRKGDFMITPNDCVKSTVADLLAGQKITYGGSKHKMFYGFLQWKTQSELLQIFADTWIKNRQNNKK